MKRTCSMSSRKSVDEFYILSRKNIRQPVLRTTYTRELLNFFKTSMKRSGNFIQRFPCSCPLLFTWRERIYFSLLKQSCSNIVPCTMKVNHALFFSLFSFCFVRSHTLCRIFLCWQFVRSYIVHAHTAHTSLTVHCYFLKKESCHDRANKVECVLCSVMSPN